LRTIASRSIGNPGTRARGRIGSTVDTLLRISSALPPSIGA
jgi:hypothetical protein